MKEYLVCEIESTDVYLLHARRLTGDEKKNYTDEYKERGFIKIASKDCVKLEEITRGDVGNILKNRHSDGEFSGCSNFAYIISKEEWDQLVRLNNQKQEVEKQKEIAAEVERCNKIIAACEKQEKLYTKEEAAKKRKAYINLHNEGGDGFVPYYYTIDEYERAKSVLKELLTN